MRRTQVVASIALLVGLVGVAGPVWADAWDRSLPTDGSSATRSELVHGSDELHDLAKKGSEPDQDWYRLSQQPYGSYEILVEATAGEIAPPVLERLAADGTTQPFTAAARNLISLSTQTVAPDVSGTITVAHDGRYGDRAGKAVSLEPATGFSFDTLLEPRPK
jgi:hypothetical protein